MRAKSERSNRSLIDRFAGFVVNAAAWRRGGTAVLAARGQKHQGLLERMAQAEVNRFLRAEIAVTLQLCQSPEGVMEQEAAYLEALGSSAAYRAIDDRLEIDDAAGETTLVFTVEAPAEILEARDAATAYVFFTS